MPRKKVVFVIVEGPSDDTALHSIFEKIYDKDTVYVDIVHGDITSEKDSNPSNIVSKVYAQVKKYADNNHFKKSNFQQIIHLMDTDGVYIPDDNVVKNDDCKEPVYTQDQILTKNPDGIIQRNINKKENMNKLCSCPSVWSIPYSAYYMSCNLDHVFHNKQNSTDEEKEWDSLLFAERYKEKIPEFLDFIQNSEFSVTGDYLESWEYIRKGLNSLHRHTNLGICFQDET